MATEDDIAAALPDPPPPRPARREAAIGEAMRRFDATGDVPVLDLPRAVPPKPARGWIGRPQVAALAGLALVVTIGVPLWRSGDLGLSPPVREAPTAAQNVAPTHQAAHSMSSTAPEAMALPAPPTSRASPEAVAPSIVADTSLTPPIVSAPMARASSPQAEKSARNEAVADAAPPPPPPPPAPAEAIAAAPAPATASARVATNDNDRDIIVTGSRVRSSKPLRRGDWNACTIDDPRRDLSACRKQFDPAAPGAEGRAAAQIADGLSLAWQGDSTDAIAAFDRAITLAPRNAPAYLNRGLAHRNSGDLVPAIADIDQAVRLAPNTARYLYYRSVLLRQRGETRKAETDERRAIDLDSRYEAVIP